MSYRYEPNTENPNQLELVIDGWEKGIGASPVGGHQAMQNVNGRFQPGMAYANYARKNISTAAFTSTYTFVTTTLTTSTQNKLVVGDVVIFTSSGAVPTGLSAGSIPPLVNPYWVVSVAGNDISVSATRGGSAISLSAGSGTQTLTSVTMATPGYVANTPSTGAPTSTGSSTINAMFIGDTNNVIWYYFTSNNLWQPFSFQCPLASGTGCYGLFIFKNYLFWIFNVSGTMYAYYISSLSSGWSAWSDLTSGVTFTVTNNHYAYWSTAPNNMCFICNGNQVASIQEVAGKTFNPTDNTTYTITAGAIILAKSEIATWIDQLFTNLLVVSKNKIYPADLTQLPTLSALGFPTFITENIVATVNIKNIIYVLAGTKGNIYYYNGYLFDKLYKMPDSIAESYDGVWYWGGNAPGNFATGAGIPLMGKNDMIYFGASFAGGNTSASFQNGIFSLSLTDTPLQTSQSGVLQLENNLTSAETGFAADAAYTLIDYAPNNQTINYMSAWYTGSVGGVDINDTTQLINDGSAYIITDLIKVGNSITPKTFSQLEITFTNTLVTGQSVQILYRTQPSGSFTSLVTFTGSVAGTGPAFQTSANIQEVIWVQFKIILFPGTSNTTNLYLRELRLW